MKKTKIILSFMISLVLLAGCGSADTQVFEKESRELTVENKIAGTELTEKSDLEKSNQEKNSKTEKTNEKSSAAEKDHVRNTEERATIHQADKNKKLTGKTNSVTTAATAPKTSRTTTKATAAMTSGTTTAASTESRTTSVPQPETIRVSLSVDCINAFNAGNEIAQAISNNGYIYGPAVFEVEKNTSVLDLLYTSGLTISATQGAFGTYISAIQSLAEFAVDGQGGWVYFVNGTMPNMSTDKYILQPGDIVEFRYTVKNGDV